MAAKLQTVFQGKLFDVQTSFKKLGIKYKVDKKFNWKKLRESISLHVGQQHVIETAKRFSIIIAGRRWGKSHIAVSDAIKTAINYRGEYNPSFPPVIVIGMPTYPMLKRVFWRKFKGLLKDCPLVENINNSELSIEFKGDRPTIYLISLNDGEGSRVLGLKIIKAYIDEIQLVKAGIIDQAIIPAMLDTPGSELRLSGTAKGKLNVAYELYQNALTDPLWSAYLFKSADNPTLPDGAIEVLQSVMDEATYRQECESSFEEIQGQILHSIKPDHLVTIEQKIEEFERIYLGVDWGDRYPAYCVIGYYQRCYYVLETWVNDGKQLITDDEFDRKLIHVCNVYKISQTFCDPAEPSSILRVRTHNPIGLQKAVRGFNRIEEGIKVINSLAHQGRLKISDRCKGFLVKIQNYSRAFDALNKVTEQIEDGQDDHEIDGMRMILATLEYKNYIHAVMSTPKDG